MKEERSLVKGNTQMVIKASAIVTLVCSSIFCCLLDNVLKLLVYVFGDTVHKDIIA